MYSLWRKANRLLLVKATAGALTFAMAVTLPAATQVMASETEEKVSCDTAEQIYEENEYAATEYTSTCGNFKYTINEDGTITLTEYEGSEWEVTVPAQLDGYTVSTIGEYAFSGKYYISSVIISEGITNIETRAFYCCYSIDEISIPASVTSIADDALWRSESGLIITLDSANQSYKIENNALVSADGKKLLAYATNNVCENYTVSNGVEKICAYAFISCSIDNLVIPDSVTEIGKEAFAYLDCDTITLSKNLVTIGESAFIEASLKDIIIPGSVKEISDNAFEDSKLETVTFEDGVEYLGVQSFRNTSLVNVTIPASINTIRWGAFSNCAYLEEIVVDPASTSFKVVNDTLCSYDGRNMIAYCLANPQEIYVIPEGVESIWGSACSNAENVVKIVLPDSVSGISSSAFYSCDSLKEIRMSHSVESIGSNAFGNCKALEGVVIPGNLDTINEDTFYGCTSLKSVFIPSEVKWIVREAFRKCNSLTSVYYVGSEAEWNEIKIADKYNDALKTATIHYLGNLKDFVSRMYSVALGRDYDAAGLNGWVQHLIEETHDGAGLAKEFVLGPEFALRSLTDEQYVDVLYTTFFNREADAAGKQLWLATLANGGTREYVLSQFVNLDEFTLLCADYDINRGVMFPDGSVAAPGLPQFVSRLYEEVLGRGADSDGLYAWTAALNTKALTAEAAAINFFNSEEYALKNVDSTTFVTDCYSVFMDREADADGLSYWVSCLEEYGVSREWVISEFAKSAEFAEIAAKYGL